MRSLIRIVPLLVALFIGGAAFAQAPNLSDAEKSKLAGGQFKVFKSTKDIPEGVRKLMAVDGKLKMVEPGQDFQVGCVGDGSLPFQRLVAVGVSADRCAVVYEQGGIAYMFWVSVYSLNPPKLIGINDLRPPVKSFEEMQKLFAPQPKRLTIGIDTGTLAKSTQTKVVPATKQEEDTIRLNGAPEHLRLTFDHKKVDYDNYYDLPHLAVYPLPAWSTVFTGNDKSEFDKSVATLKKIIAGGSLKGVSEIPVFPQTDAAQVTYAQPTHLKFKNGAGIAFVSSYSNGDMPPGNGRIFYTFQGISNDGKHYVSLFWPVKAIGFKDNLPMDKACAFLRRTPRAKFTPNLATIDKMIESISLQ